jgi:glycosyltransferase involved in cell wall biosynthesis
VVIIDADLQDPPELILEMIEKWRAGYEVVYAVRSEREGESWFKTFTASFFYRLIYRITDVKIPLDTGDFRLMDRKVVAVMNSMRERHRFLARDVGLGWLSSKSESPIGRSARFAGETKYPFRKMFRLAIECDHRIFLLPAAGGNIHRVLRSRIEYFGNSSGHYFAPGFRPGAAWPGNHTDRRIVYRRRTTDFTGYLGGVYRTNI